MLGKKKELLASIEELKAKLDEQESLINELKATVEAYKQKESAIAGALTRAQADAALVIEEANAEKARIIAKANEDKAAAKLEADKMIEQAKQQADTIRNEADEYSRQSALKTEAYMENYRESARQLNSALKRAAEAAAMQAEHFRSYVSNANLDNEIEMAGEYAASAGVAAGDMPESYNNPAELMQSIYRIERRPLAANEDNSSITADTSHPEDGEHVGPAFHHRREDTMDIRCGEYHAEWEHHDHPHDDENHIETHYCGPTAMLRGDAEASSIEANEAPMMTVNEIINQAGDEPEAEKLKDSIEDELNAIIDDVLKDS